MAEPVLEEPAAGGVAVEVVDLLDELENAAALAAGKAVPAAVVDVEGGIAVGRERRARPPVINLAAALVADEPERVKDAPLVGVVADLAQSLRIDEGPLFSGRSSQV